MVSQEIYKLLDILSKSPGEGAGDETIRELNSKRQAALQDLVLRCEVIDDEVLDRLEAVVSSDEDTAIRVAALKAIVSLLKKGPVWNELAKRLLKFLANDREQVWEQAADALAELEPPGQESLEKQVRQAVLAALWARLGAADSQPDASNGIARAILKIQAKDNTTRMLDIAFDRLASADPQDRSASVAFLKTSVGWHLLMSSEDQKKAIARLLEAFRAVSSRARMADIVKLLVDLTPYPELFRLLLPRIAIPQVIFEPENTSPPSQPGPASGPDIVRWKQAVFLVDPRVRNFVNENIMKRRIRLVLKGKEEAGGEEKIKWYEDVLITREKKTPELKPGTRVKIIDRSAHSNWFQIETEGVQQGWIDATTELTPIVYSLIDESKPEQEKDSDAILLCRYNILSLMLGELQDGNQDVRQNMISWLRECDQYFTPRERMLVSNALWDCVMQHGQGLRAYAAIDLRVEEQAMKEAVREIVYSYVDRKVIGLVGGLLLKEGARELDTLYEMTDQQEQAQLKAQEEAMRKAREKALSETPRDASLQTQDPSTKDKQPGYPHKERIMPFILGALESEEEQVCQLALVWVYRRASGRRDEDYIPGSFVRDLVTRMRRLALESGFPNVRRSAKTNLIPITEKNSAFLLEQFESKGALAVDIINELVEMESPAVMNALIRKWGYWIAETDRSQLVEAASLELRANKSAILPLLERLREPLRFEDDEEIALKVKALNQEAPLYADRLLEKYLLNPKELVWWRRKKDEERRKLLLEAAMPEAAPPETAQEEKSPPPLEDWMKSLIDRGGKYGELDQLVKDNGWEGQKPLQEFAKLFWETELERRKTLVMGRVALQLAEMSSPRFFESEKYRDGAGNPAYISIKAELRTHAVPYLAHRLPGEEDLTLREHMARTLANVGELEAVDALALAIVAEDRAKAIRQKVLSEYYLEPSKRRSDQAAKILDDAVHEATDTMRIIQKLSVATFALGVVIVGTGILLVVTGDPKSAEKLFGLFASIGGIAGIITLLIKSPLNDIQNSIANLVQLETAFTNFIWELNLNSTYIQSEYVQEGVIGNDVVATTIERMESAMSTAMSVIALYTEEGRERAFAHINSLSPVSGGPGTEIRVMGQYLKGDDGRNPDPKDRVMVAINHKRTNATIDAASWARDCVQFTLKAGDLPILDKDPGPVWISLLIDGVETNALPFELKMPASAKKPQNGNGTKMQPDIQLIGAEPLAGSSMLPDVPDNPKAN
ncbi:MAG: hypothetical protein ACM3XO_11325 [Bacteroidota bacterium]